MSVEHADPDAAATSLAARLKLLADHLAGTVTAQRIPFGQSRLGGLVRRRSPAGFVIDANKRHLLLPDGRLWSYSRSDAARYPDGRIYDPRLDHTQFADARTFPGGTEFFFLGAVVGRYRFGFAANHGLADGGLCALVSDGGTVRFVEPDDAFADLAESLPASGNTVSRR